MPRGPILDPRGALGDQFWTDSEAGLQGIGSDRIRLDWIGFGLDSDWVWLGWIALGLD